MKKFLVFSLSLALILSLLFLPSNTYAAHTHTLVFVHEKQATCTEQGNIHHYRCTSCGELFYDCQGKRPLSVSDACIPAIEHDWGEWTIVNEATEDSEGLKVRYCKRDCSPEPLKITLDAGHGATNNKGYYSGFYEGANNFEIMTYLTEYLNEYDNVIVYNTRAKVTDNPANPDRAKMAVDTGSEVFISLHSNSVDSTKAWGVSVFRSFIRPESEDLARKLAQTVVDVMRPDTGITYLRGGGPMLYTEPAYGPELGDGETQDWYNVIRNSVVSEKCRYSIILEHGFHSNPTECEWLMSSSNLRKVAKAEAEAIADYFGLAKKGSAPAYEHCKEEQTIPKLNVDNPPVVEPLPIVHGDINGDGAVNNKDVSCLFKYISGDSNVAVVLEACDVNKDGSINNKDVITLFNIVSEVHS